MDGEPAVVTIDDASVSYNDTALTVSGTVYATLGGVDKPLFKGSFSLPYNGPTTSQLTDSGAFPGKFDLGGLDVDFEFSDS